MSQKSTVKCRRSLGAPDISTERDDTSRLGAAVRERHNSADVSRLAPHSPQNLLLAGLVAPHREHVIGNPDPHCVQKRFLCGLSALQLRHFIETAWKLLVAPAIRHCEACQLSARPHDGQAPLVGLGVPLSRNGKCGDDGEISVSLHNRFDTQRLPPKKAERWGTRQSRLAVV